MEDRIEITNQEKLLQRLFPEKIDENRYQINSGDFYGVYSASSLQNLAEQMKLVLLKSNFPEQYAGAKIKIIEEPKYIDLFEYPTKEKENQQKINLPFYDLFGLSDIDPLTHPSAKRYVL